MLAWSKKLCRNSLRTGRVLMLPIVFLLVTGRILAATYFVSPTGNDGNTGTTRADPFLRIQTALDAAAGNADPSDIINIASGIYPEQLDIHSDVTLIGAGATTVIHAPTILALDVLNKRSIVRIGRAASVVMSDLTVSGPATDKIDFGILVVEDASLNLTNAAVTAIRLSTARRSIFDRLKRTPPFKLGSVHLHTWVTRRSIPRPSMITSRTASSLTVSVPPRPLPTAWLRAMGPTPGP